MGGLFSAPESQAVDLESPEAKYIRGITHEKCVVVFSKTVCPHCKEVKRIFEDFSANYTTVELDKREDGKKMQAILGKMTNASTVPRVFIKGSCIGGADDTKKLRQSGRLEEMLRECNAID
ncbi:uncharacterized protein [Diadema setosum]|uniref:uncharacterized protein n=1 Tax=Diadema setosum TaxID=31175 RepID=UPI003B3BDCE9